VLLLEDQPPLGVHRDSKKAPNKNIDPDIPGTHTGPLKRSSFVKMSNVATVENATPNPRQMIAKKYFTFMGLARRFPLVLRCCDLAPSHALSTKTLAASEYAAPRMAAVLTSRHDCICRHARQCSNMPAGWALRASFLSIAEKPTERPVCILDQSQESEVPCHAPRRRGQLVKLPHLHPRLF